MKSGSWCVFGKVSKTRILPEFGAAICVCGQKYAPVVPFCLFCRSVSGYNAACLIFICYFMAVRSKSSSAWLNEHVNDHYVHLAQKDGYRARAAYKLLEINEKDRLLKPGVVVADLGSAPGSWSQVAAQLVGAQGRVFALDILPMEAIAGVSFIQGDFREDHVLAEFEKLLAGRAPDLVICDMAPNMSGNNVTDQAKSFYLAELALDFAARHLKSGGDFLVKVFQGAGYQEYVKLLRESFAEVVVRKPKASRDRSNEIYLLARKLH